MGGMGEESSPVVRQRVYSECTTRTREDYGRDAPGDEPVYSLVSVANTITARRIATIWNSISLPFVHERSPRVRSGWEARDTGVPFVNPAI
jgi:hypothetical protein